MPGELVMNRMQAWSGMFAVSKQEGLVSPDYSVFGVIGTTEVSYFEHLFKTPLLVDQFAQCSKGIGSGFNRLYTPDFGAISLVVPSLPEQSAIVRFLAHFDRRINRLIRAKRRLIELLNEQKQAIIHRAVTRGLDPNVRLKPSSIDWLGEVPEHWEVVTASRVTQIFVPQRDKPELNEVEGTRWITPECTGDKYVSHRRLFVSPQEASRIGARPVPALSVIASCVGRFGIASINEEPVIINQQLQAFIPGCRINRGFLRYCVQIAKPYFDMAGNSTTLAYVNRQGFQCMPLPLPSVVEQEEIVTFIEREEANVARGISKISSETSLLREYRTRLITDVVTGKLDVRGVIEAGNGPSSSSGPYPGLPDEAEGLDDLDTGKDAEAEEIIDTEEKDE